MLGKKRTQEITDGILRRSTADQTEVLVLASDSYLTRFANSTIHQNVAETNAEVRIRLVLGGADGAAGKRVGVAATNDLTEEALARALENAMAIARLQPENPNFHSLPEPRPITEVEAFSQATADCTPEQRAEGVGVVCNMAHSAGVLAFGALTTAVQEVAVANSLGISAYYPATYADINTVVMGDSGSGYASALAVDYEALDFQALGREAVEKCLHSQAPRPLEPGEYTVILEPYAVQDLVQMMAYTGLGAVPFQEGWSFMSGRIGEEIVDPRVSIWDDGLDPEGIPLPFDFEGVPKRPVDLIRDGVARGVVYDSYYAGKEGKQSTGHALPTSDFRRGPLPLNAFFAGGEATLEEMIASTERGIYVTRFHYTRPVEPRRVVITGMTRDGTFLIEKGEITHPVKNLRFTQSYLEALNHVVSIGRDRRLLLGLGNLARDSVPALKLDGFTFTGATEF